MNELLKINYENERPTISARELYKSLEIEKRFSSWFETNSKGFVEGEDFTSVLSSTVVNNGAFRDLQDYQMSMDMAKHIALMSRTEKGRHARQYLIDVEKQWNSPEMIMKRALDFANEAIKKLQLVNNQLTVDKQIMQPKAEYFDELVDRNLLTNFRDTAKQLEIKEKLFIAFLIDKKYIYRDKKGKLMPYADKNNDLFEVKECFNEKTNWSGIQALITPKGRETFRLLMKGMQKMN